MLAPGRWADVTVMSIDPMAVRETDPAKLFDGQIVATIVAGKVAFEAKR